MDWTPPPPGRNRRPHDHWVGHPYEWPPGCQGLGLVWHPQRMPFFTIHRAVGVTRELGCEAPSLGACRCRGLRVPAPCPRLRPRGGDWRRCIVRVPLPPACLRLVERPAPCSHLRPLGGVWCRGSGAGPADGLTHAPSYGLAIRSSLVRSTCGSAPVRSASRSRFLSSTSSRSPFPAALRAEDPQGGLVCYC